MNAHTHTYTHKPATPCRLCGIGRNMRCTTLGYKPHHQRYLYRAKKGCARAGGRGDRGGRLIRERERARARAKDGVGQCVRVSSVCVCACGIHTCQHIISSIHACTHTHTHAHTPHTLAHTPAHTHTHTHAQTPIGEDQRRKRSRRQKWRGRKEA